MNSSVPPPRARRLDPLIGQVIDGKYKVVELVAWGGMGKIYRAEQMPLGRAVALKVLRCSAEPELDLDGDPNFKKRFLREASILARLQHPNIVTIFDYGSIDGPDGERFFISMEFLQGETLSRRINDRVTLATGDTIRIARQIARGLVEAHAHGVIHRDLKPSNVMLVPGRDGEEHVKILDFGIVKVVGEESHDTEELTQEGSFVGSPKYMAPEQIARGGKIDVRTDVYSFGIILYQCLTGTVPFDADSSLQTLMAHLNEHPQPIRERTPSAEVPAWLDEMVMACIDKDPERRPQSMDAVARTLAEAEVALKSNELLSVITTRRSSPNLGGATPDAPLVSKSGRHASRSSLTTPGFISSVRPPVHESDRTRTSPRQRQEERKRGLWLLLLVGTAGLLVASAGLFALRQRAPQPVAVATAPPPVPPAPAAHYTLRIESTPAGADVREGDHVLGTTPLEIAIDNDAAKSGPRVLTLAKDGYAPYEVTQGASTESVRVVANLVALPPPAASSAAAPAAPKRGVHASPAAASAASPGRPDLDIRLNR